MVNNNNIWMIVSIALVVAVVASIITANITGNTIRLNQDKNGIYNVYTKMEIDSTVASLNSTIGDLRRLPVGNYMDPTRCYLNTSWTQDSYTGPNGTRIYNPTMTVQCGYNQFVGEVTHIDCQNFANIRTIVGTGWSDNTLPNSLTYTCVDANGGWNAPSQIYGYCCDIVSGTTNPITTPTIAKTSTVDRTTKRITVR